MARAGHLIVVARTIENNVLLLILVDLPGVKSNICTKSGRLGDGLDDHVDRGVLGGGVRAPGFGGELLGGAL